MGSEKCLIRNDLYLQPVRIMKLRLSSREFRLIGAVTLGVILVGLTLVLVSHFVKESFLQAMGDNTRVSGKIDLAGGVNPFVVRKKIDPADASKKTVAIANTQLHSGQENRMKKSSPAETTGDVSVRKQPAPEEGAVSQATKPNGAVQPEEVAVKQVIKSNGAGEMAVEPAPDTRKTQTTIPSEKSPLQLPQKEPEAETPRYSLHLASCRAEANCRSILDQYEGSDIAAYTKRVDLGDKGVWHRVYLGDFSSKEQARLARQKYSLPEARILKVQ